ncbi:ATP-binding cassette domain-containing protein [Lentibacillus sp. CBA3610]|uniref:ATP-binding cassette domain-containing protein n=1 Tax=Lentibacillus sp. CBA3610 TaxID=2518176 RepID=UPI0020D21A88|nr:ATP-binding cassette domain-containing protein [Lentibacillus sp. CBA3610]
MKRFGLEAYQHTRLSHLSKGNKQKVNIIQGFLILPELFLLDEPTSGLDPDSQETMTANLTQLKKEGTTIVLTHHESDLAERLADRNIHVTQQNIKELKTFGKNKHYRTIEFTGTSKELLSFVSSSADIIQHVCQSSSSHIISVYAAKSNALISSILALGGTIQFVSRQTNMLPMLAPDDTGKVKVNR